MQAVDAPYHCSLPVLGHKFLLGQHHVCVEGSFRVGRDRAGRPLEALCDMAARKPEVGPPFGGAAVAVLGLEVR